MLASENNRNVGSRFLQQHHQPSDGGPFVGENGTDADKIDILRDAR